MNIEIEEREAGDGVTEFLGRYRNADGRLAACLIPVHGSRYVCELPGLGHWEKLPEFDRMAEFAKEEIRIKITRLVNS